MVEPEAFLINYEKLEVNHLHLLLFLSQIHSSGKSEGQPQYFLTNHKHFRVNILLLADDNRKVLYPTTNI